MKISFDWIGTYTEHKPFFDAMAIAMQKEGHQVGIITGEREARRPEIERSLGFVPDFFNLWGDYETIANGALWKCQRMDEQDVYMHYDDEASSMKLFTERWIVKTLNSADKGKF